MSSSHQLGSLSSRSPSPDLTAITAMLSEAAQALQAFSGPRQPPMKESAASAGETRCYYLSPAALKHERELLQKYRVDDFRGLLKEAHTLLAGLVKVMQSMHPDARLRGHVVSSLGASLEQVSALLVRMRNLCDKAEKIPS